MNLTHQPTLFGWNDRSRTRTFLVFALLLFCSAGVLIAQVRPTHRPDLPNFDNRTPVPLKQERLAEREAERIRLTSQVSSAVVDFDPLLETPKFIRSTDGLLSGPGSMGGGISPQATTAFLPNDPYLPIKAFLNEHSALFGHDARVLDSARIKREYSDTHNGLHTVVWEQMLDGIPVYQSVLMGHITKKGELTSMASTFISDAAASADAGTPNRAALQAAPAISAAEAVLLAANNIGANLALNDILPSDATPVEGGYQIYQTPEQAFVRQAWLPLHHSAMRLAWEVMVSSHSTKERFRLVVDAQTGVVQLRENLTCYISDASYNVWTSDSPSPFSPGLQVPGTTQPPLTNRFLVTTSALDTIASPDGWVPDGTNVTTTGNNFDAFVDRNFDQQPDRARPAATNRVFDFTQDLTQDPTNYIDASTVQLFYSGNVYHDRLYQLGFTEAAGNYQQDNFGRGGLANDRIIGYVQAGADVGLGDNSFFSPAPDGSSGQCFMFVFTGPNPERDGSLDDDVVFHELTHGTSWRLVGGGMTLGSLQGNGMGEGWSDFYALCLSGQPTDNPNAAYAAGGYASYLFAGTGFNQNYYYGIRHFPYCTDIRKNPFTFKDIDPAQISSHPGVPRSPLYPFDPTEANEVHHQGEVWCVTLWELHANLVNKYGWAIGNQLALQLVTDGMKLTPPVPTFLQARDAILLADQVDNAGANVNEIWRAFAKRGMGVSARSPNSNTTSGVVEAFDTPGLQVFSVDVQGGNGNAVADPNECDNLQIIIKNNSGFFATGISARLSSSTPGVLVTQPLSPYPVMPDGTTNVNITPFTISVAPSVVCGTTLNFILVVKSDQATTTNLFSLPTGVSKIPLRFDNNTIAQIPDLGTTNSTVQVTNIDFAITKLTVSLDIVHTFDGDLVLQLVGPDGTTCTLARNRGSNGNGYGIACSPDTVRTTFDDGATNPISSGVAPFVGSFQPEQSLSRFAGKSGTNVNGAWRLVVSDTAGGDVGFIRCWSLFLTPTLCQDGGGECPGADLAIGMTSAPEPDIVGANLTYTLSVTNNGPSLAKTVSVSQVLPDSVTFVSAVCSQGSASQSGGVVTANLGKMVAGGTATVTVIVVPNVVGDIASSAVVSSEQTDFNLVNNSASLLSHINPPTADLNVQLVASPIDLFVGGAVTYTMTLINNGPSIATGVLVTNVFPDGLALLSETTSQGSLAVAGNTVVCTIGTLASGATATAIVTATPIGEGTLTATATALGNQLDPALANNTASAVVTVGPAADLAMTIDARPNPVVLSSNLTFVTTVTNGGPSIATNVVVNETLPTGVTVVSTTLSQGTYSINGSSLVADLGTLGPGGTATITVVINSSRIGTLTASGNVAAALTDPNTANNSASFSAQVSQPFVSIVPAGASLVVESFSPPNGSVDAGETVTLQLRLQNLGNVVNTNLVATLLASGGVTAPSAPQTYGVLKPIGVPGGAPVSRSFTFTASPGSIGSVVATLQLKDGNNTLAPATFTFVIPTQATFANTTPISIPAITSTDGSGIADIYPSLIHVSGITSQVGKVTATLSGLTHTYPHDINALLVGPTGASTLLMSHAAGQSSANDLTLTFDDGAAAALAETGPILSGSWKPSAYAPVPIFSNPAPAGPYTATMGTFSGINPNGDWLLYLLDDSLGDIGSLANGWSLDFQNVTPVNQLADLSLSVVANPKPSLVGGPLTYTFTITNVGPSGATGVTFSNAVPAGMTLLTATVSQGNVTTNGNLILANLFNVAVGASATVTVVVKPTPAVTGFVTNSASVAAFETDLHAVDNVASIVSAINLPVADLAASITANPTTVVVGTNLTYGITIVNNGPGTALNTVLTDPLPAGTAYRSASTSQGSVSFNGGAVVASLGDMPAGSSANVTVVLGPLSAGSLTNSVSLSTASSDPGVNNNSARAVVQVINPAPAIVPVGAHLVSENLAPNGAIDPGETVTISFTLANTGVIDTANLVATLLPTGGVTAPSAPATYGQLLQGGASVARPFTFTAGAPANGVITATLQLNDGAKNLGTVAFTFSQPVVTSYSSTGGISIPDHGSATPYPATINVSGLTGVVSKATVVLNGLTHKFPSDVNVLLVSPTGRNVLLMSHTGGSHSITNLTLTFDDGAGAALPNGTVITSGTYQPSAYGAPAAFPPAAPTAPYGSVLAALNNSNPNGTWSLYVLDDATGDSGSIASGWSLNLTTAIPVNPLVDLAIGMTTSSSSLYAGYPLTYNLTVTNQGPDSAPAVVVSDPLPFGLKVTSATTSQGTISVSDNNSVTGTLGDLPAGSGATVTIVTMPFLTGTFLNAATALSDGTELNPTDNSARASTTVLVPAPVSLSGSVTNGQFQLTITTVPGQTFDVQASSDLSSWTSLGLQIAPDNGIIVIQDPITLKVRFYRAIQQ